MKQWILILLLGMVSLPACKNEAGAGKPDTAQKNEEPSENTEIPENEVAAGMTEDYLNMGRLVWQKPEVVMRLMGDVSNKTVADIGAGRGFFALRLAPMAKKVIALDIYPEFTNYLDSIKVYELPENIQSRLETRLSEPDLPKLGPNEADVVLIVNTYMYLADRVDYLRKLKPCIAKGGKLVIVDFKKKRTPRGPPNKYRVPLFQAEEELYQAGYTNIITDDTSLDYQYIITAE
ncbi:MAG: methyltransferase domain-containing protein [Lewinella sp.]|nr:methyltransferase domain-containing protein [Lewinella sp.]